MPRITIHVSRLTGEDEYLIFSERVSAANLASEHYTAQLVERLAWATADAEAIETGTTHIRRRRNVDADARGAGLPAPGVPLVGAGSLTP
jgi:hypothetical protein